ncbi:hypothetical protein F5J12DRAFT_785306 [Pisolithus orientalis]|uniref:uncharacterized protein n=1 Tax=Pisolithus orientalis TaxID=936130 RepID=UPI002224DD12|nr:uncharacterized protein F5J12DRAFT_785306 [Pisolithus orientalis]KAI5996891.1 hypothetical protein F5J12DRAFT_785306 [Pisolithus orientalis]
MNKGQWQSWKEAAKLHLRCQSLKENTVKVPAVSEEVQQLADELLVSKIPLKFEAERLKEQVMPTRVKVEELEMLAGSPKAKRLADEEVVGSHRMPQCTNCADSRVIARRSRIEEPSRHIIGQNVPDEPLRSSWGIVLVCKGCPMAASKAALGHPSLPFANQWDVPQQPLRLHWDIPLFPLPSSGMSHNSLQAYIGTSHPPHCQLVGCPPTASKPTLGHPTLPFANQWDVPQQPLRLYWDIPPSPLATRGMSQHSL